MRKLFLLCRTAIFLTALAALFFSTDAKAGETGFTGMQVQGITKELAATLGLKEIKGVLIRDLDLGGPADRAGLRRGDLIVKFAGQEIDTFERLISAVGTVKPGQEVPVKVMRNGKAVDITLKTIKRPEARSVTNGSFAAIPEAGLTLAALTEKVRKSFGLRWSSTGVVITLVDETKSTGMDLKRGEIIVQANQQDVWNPKQVIELFQEAKGKGEKSILLLVEGFEGKRNGFRFSVLPVR